MSAAGSPIDMSLVQAAQAQRTASKARDRERAAEERTQRYSDLLELRVAGVELADALRQLPQNDSEQAGAEHEAKGHHQPNEPKADDEERPHIDVTA
jgi:hypothetical protein